jgi:hypothetical protein
MNIEEETIKNKNRIKMSELKIKAIINLLSKEGILTHEEVEEEVNDLISKKEETPGD